jgi:hypothetical protein
VYQFVLTATATVTITTDLPGSGTTDTALYVRSVCINPGDEVGCDDDSGTGLTSLLVLPALGPGTYYVFVDTYSATSGGPYEVRASW